MASSLPRVFNIPASAPFLKVLVDALLDGRLVPGFAPRNDPLALASATLYLPTRRACRSARDAFLEALGDAAILPRIVPIGDVDEDELTFAQAATGAAASDALDLPEALGSLDRRLLLAQLIANWANSPGVQASGGAPLVANTPAATLDLADALARLIDDMTTRRVPWDKLDDLVPADLDKYWQQTLEFLKIARVFWPARLQELGKIDAAVRRDRLIQAEIARLSANNAPVIAAGSTGSMPATADLLAAVAKLAHGAVVLPGLDTDLDNASWDKLGGDPEAKPHDGGIPASAHPQFSMHGLLERIGILRRDVAELAEPAAFGRENYVSEALRPAATTEHWVTWLRQPDVDARRLQALKSVTVIETATAEDEALAIAVALRETAETPDRTAALITPDRALARRVLAALERWQVHADDSGGDALAETPAGVFARLTAEVALKGAEPVTLLALLKHPSFRLGHKEHADRHAIETLEFALFRGPRPKRGSASLSDALASLRDGLKAGEIHRSDPRHRLKDREFDEAAALIARIVKAVAPLEGIDAKSMPFSELAKRHRDCVVALGGDGEAIVPFLSLGGRELSKAFDEIIATPHATELAVVPGDYADLFYAAIAGRIVRKPELPGVRIRVFGPLEARLQKVDRVVLGGLVEGTWPPETRTDAWLNRPMRHGLGLDAPERRIGLSAHDFAQALGAEEVFLTRAAKVGGAPTVMSRFVQRLSALAGDEWDNARKRGEKYTAWAQTLDRPASPPKPIDQPAPSPARDRRPKQLSVTEIEHWMRDPYTIYAKHILRLRPLDPVDTPPGYADRGTLIHGAVAEFTESFAKTLPKDSAAQLIEIGKKHFRPMEDFPEAKAFWWPRFLRIAAWFADWEKARRGIVETMLPEIKGETEIARQDIPFKLTTRADRIERLKDGSYRIIDYKTGRLPGNNEVIVGFSPQLTLEAAILRRGGFEGIAKDASIADLVYVRLNGARPVGENRTIDIKDGTADELADRTFARLTALVGAFDSDTQPYKSMVNPMWKARYGDYDHLERIKEWSVQRDEDEF
jgi:ATP-dependent helicase/nuclease subunit B